MEENEKKLGFKKQINISKKGYISFIEHAKIVVANKTVCFVTKDDKKEYYYNIPYLNTSILFLGSGCSISNEAARMLAEGNVLVMFTNTKFKVSMATDLSYLPLLPIDEFKTNKYNVEFAKIYINDNLRLEKAKKVMNMRMDNNFKFYKLFQKDNYIIENILDKIEELNNEFKNKFNNCSTVLNILQVEALYVKSLYIIFANMYNIKFKKNYEYKVKEKEINDFNQLINNNLIDLNYLCYGMSAATLNSLGISFSFPLFHGKTRRGGLVYDIADLFKDSFSITFAFYAALIELNRSELRKLALENIDKYKIFDLFFEQVMEIINENNSSK